MENIVNTATMTMTMKSKSESERLIENLCYVNILLLGAPPHCCTQGRIGSDYYVESYGRCQLAVLYFTVYIHIHLPFPTFLRNIIGMGLQKMELGILFFSHTVVEGLPWV